MSLVGGAKGRILKSLQPILVYRYKIFQVLKLIFEEFRKVEIIMTQRRFKIIQTKNTLALLT